MSRLIFKMVFSDLSRLEGDYACSEEQWAAIHKILLKKPAPEHALRCNLMFPATLNSAEDYCTCRGACSKGEQCNCGGNTPFIREGCAYWRKAEEKK